jgi:hypothetical protein
MSEPIGNTEQLVEPVACRYDFDGYGYMYMDAGSGSDWAVRLKDCEFLYTHPQKELTRKDYLAKLLLAVTYGIWLGYLIWGYK